MRKSTKILSIIAIALAILIGGSISAYAFIKPVQNAVKLAIMKPDKLYKEVNKNYVSENSKSVSNLYAKVANSLEGKSEIGESSSIKMTFGEEILNEMKAPDLKSISLNSTMSSKDKKTAQNFSLSYDDKKLITVNTTTDIEAKTSYVQVPELSDTYLSMKPEDLKPFLEKQGLSTENFAGSGSLSQYTSLLDGTSLKELSLSQSDIDNIIKRYSDILVNGTSKVTKESNYKGDIDGVKYNYTKLTAKLTYQNIIDISDDLVSELKKDDTIKNAIVKQGICTEEQYEKGLDQVLDGINNDELPDGVKKDDVFATVVTLVDNNLNVVGREIKIDTKDTNGDFGYTIIDNDKNYAVKVLFTVDGEDVLNYEGSATKKNNKLTGDFKFTMDTSSSTKNTDDEDSGSDSNIKATSMKNDKLVLNIKLEDYEIVDKDANLVSGKITASMDAEGKKVALAFDCKVDNKKQTINMTLSADDKMAATVEISYEPTQAADIKIPDSSAKVINALDEKELQKYFEDADIEGLTKNLEDAIGKENADQFISGFTQGFKQELDKKTNTDLYTDDTQNWTNNKPSTKTDDLNTSNNSINQPYDFSRLTYNFEGAPISLPNDYMTFAMKVTGKDGTVPASGTKTFSNVDLTYNVTLRNNGPEETIFEKCKLLSIQVNAFNDAKVPFSVQGISVGSTYPEVASAFGINKSAPNNDSFYVMVYSNDGSMNSIFLTFANGKVVSINESFEY